VEKASEQDTLCPFAPMAFISISKMNENEDRWDVQTSLINPVLVSCVLCIVFAHTAFAFV